MKRVQLWGVRCLRRAGPYILGQSRTGASRGLVAIWQLDGQGDVIDQTPWDCGHEGVQRAYATRRLGDAAFIKHCQAELTRGLAHE